MSLRALWSSSAGSGISAHRGSPPRAARLHGAV